MTMHSALAWTAGFGASHRQRLTTPAGTIGRIAGVATIAPRNDREAHEA